MIIKVVDIFPAYFLNLAAHSHFMILGREFLRSTPVVYGRSLEILNLFGHEIDGTGRVMIISILLVRYQSPYTRNAV